MRYRLVYRHSGKSREADALVEFQVRLFLEHGLIFYMEVVVHE